VRIGSLCTGIGGLDLAIPGEHVWMCEYDKHCQVILDRQFPGVPVYPDIRGLGADTPRIDIITAGYPCQPFSHAGKRQGEADPRHLWPEVARCVGLLRPRFALLENVSGHLGLGFDRVLADLAQIGYDAKWVVVRASDVGAPHRRERLFVVATNAESVGWDGWQRELGKQAETDGRHFGETEKGSDEPSPGTTGTERRGAELKSVGATAGPTAEHRERNRENTVGSQTSSDSDSTGLQGIGPEPGEAHEGRTVDGDRASQQPDWGVYEAAIRHWEHILGVEAPRPTDDEGRLQPTFVEWMQGFPIGWTDGVSRTQRLKMLGNSVVPQQAAYAVDLLAGFK